ncbi:MAG: hypothetical protein AAF211_28730, partial [Myxococcota bacterium]
MLIWMWVAAAVARPECDVDGGRGCLELADIAAELDRDRKADRLRQRACTSRHPEACGAWWNVDPDEVRTILEAATEACAEGDARVCSRLATWRLRGPSVERDRADARRLLELACDTNDGATCLRLAQLLERQGPDDRFDPVEARRRFTQACAADGARGCREAAERQIRGAGGPPDVDAAYASLGRACDARRTRACWELADWHIDGRGLPPRPEAAAEALAPRPQAAAPPESASDDPPAADPVADDDLPDISDSQVEALEPLSPFNAPPDDDEPIGDLETVIKKTPPIADLDTFVRTKEPDGDLPTMDTAVPATPRPDFDADTVQPAPEAEPPRASEAAWGSAESEADDTDTVTHAPPDLVEDLLEAVLADEGPSGAHASIEEPHGSPAVALSAAPTSPAPEAPVEPAVEPLGANAPTPELAPSLTETRVPAPR